MNSLTSANWYRNIFDKLTNCFVYTSQRRTHVLQDDASEWIYAIQKWGFMPRGFTKEVVYLWYLLCPNVNEGSSVHIILALTIGLTVFSVLLTICKLEKQYWHCFWVLIMSAECINQSNVETGLWSSRPMSVFLPIGTVDIVIFHLATLIDICQDVHFLVSVVTQYRVCKITGCLGFRSSFH